MKKIPAIGIACCVVAGLWGIARAEGGASRKSAEPAETFDETVDPSRFRKGNPDWDTQNLIANGMKALHEEQIRILDKLGRIESRLEKLDRLESRLDELEKSLGNIERK